MWNQFDKHDWMAFNGAEPFKNLDGSTSEPFVNYALKVDDLDACAVADANGLWIQVLLPNGEEVANFTGGPAQAILFVLRSANESVWGTTELLEMGLDEERADH